MKNYIEQRVVDVSNYIIANTATVRDAAKAFGVSKTTVHKDVTERVFGIDRALHDRVSKVLESNLNSRHIRGGIATKAKYAAKKN